MGTPRKKAIKPRQPPPPPTPKAPKPWDPLPLATKGDADAAKTFEAVGRAISSWELLEAHFGLIFSVFVDSTSVVDGAMRAYGSVTSFSGRHDMIKAASVPHFLLYPNDSLRTQVDDLLEAARQFSTRRNEIAHGIVQPHFKAHGQDGWSLVPSYFATKKRMVQTGEKEDSPLTAKVNYTYASEQLLHWMTHFRDLGARAISTYYALEEARTAGKASRRAKSLARLLKEGSPKSPEAQGTNPKPQRE